jgi:hypothetical protein
MVSIGYATTTAPARRSCAGDNPDFGAFPGFPPPRIRVNLRIFAVVLTIYDTGEVSVRHSRESGNPG